MSLIDLIKDALPNIAKAATGPAGDFIISMVSDKLGVSTSDLETHIQNNPQVLSSLSDMDKTVQKLLDLKNAREREVEAMKSDNVMVKITTPIIAIMTILMTFGMGLIMSLNKIPIEQNQIAIFVLGFMTSSATQVFSYYFGSSQTQDASISNLNKK
jgi:hypothetical protein